MEFLNLVDIGVNLLSPAFDQDREAVIARAFAAGVQTLIITGSSIADSVEAAAFAHNRHANCITNCVTTAGVHPHNAKDWDESARQQLWELVTREPYSDVIAAIGECGLDYNRNFSPPYAQRQCFEDQLALAAQNASKKQRGMPVFLHERDAFDDFVPILKQYRADLSGVVVHCFTGGMKELEAYLALDCYIGITGWVCDERRGEHLIPLLRHIPADRLLLETDAPYLLPRNLPRSARGKNSRNEPCFLPHIAAFAAEILGKTPEQLAAETSANAARLFAVDFPC
ncbi:MAG: TatD family hydrolase [Treponema sp.]|nr:TatD family hydrolase [Treponema sp.]